ncbi:ABC transporter ATP-binding protein [Paracoccus suum]|uniref:ABC transporter ATP-binding protein n=1 Tax=Paracoccus suum TaxID=2259340 RepID=A0A344PMZ5_9RHOB|nr:ABC transporter ATP-binding protein [Paracoccus suum]AXC50750.1 ABC transporter ATP-binding protein [Paracoccus suum]
MGSLSLEHVRVSFGGLNALTDVSLTMGPAGILGLIGPNGAGKSTCINVMTGFQKASAGRVLLDGRAIGGPPAAFRHAGISRTFQAGRLFATLTVAENLAAAAIGMGLSRRAAATEADRVLDQTGIAQLAHEVAAVLPYTDQRRVAIARATVCQPKFLLLDEPAAGMSQQEAQGLADTIRTIRANEGPAVLLVEHQVGLVLSLCDEIAVLDRGRIIALDTPDAIARDEVVREAYLGTSGDAHQRKACA